MAAKAVCEMTLVGIPNGQSRINHTHSCPQELACARDSNALQISMRWQADRFRERMRNVEGAAGGQRSEFCE